MIGRDRRLTPRGAVAAALLGSLLSQPGHLAVFMLRYEGHGLALSTQGIHTYLAAVLPLTFAGLGVAALLALLVLGLGRLALGHALGRARRPGPPLLLLFAVVAAVQMLIYAAQETAEMALDRSVLDAAALASMLVWGAAGQLPLALLAAMALRWLMVRLLVVATAIRSTLATVPRPAPDILPTAIEWHDHDQRADLRGIVPAAFRKRGPPRRRVVISRSIAAANHAGQRSARLLGRSTPTCSKRKQAAGPPAPWFQSWASSSASS